MIGVLSDVKMAGAAALSEVHCKVQGTTLQHPELMLEENAWRTSTQCSRNCSFLILCIAVLENPQIPCFCRGRFGASGFLSSVGCAFLPGTGQVFSSELHLLLHQPLLSPLPASISIGCRAISIDS